MALNVHDQIANARPTLVGRMVQNEFVTSTIMGYLNLFTGLAVKFGRPVESVRIGKLQELRGGVFSAPLTFTDAKSPTSAMWTPQSDFERFVNAKAKHMSEALKRNAHLEKWFADLVDVVESFARARGSRYEDIVIIDPIVTRELTTVMFKLVRKPPIG